ncbi:Zinc finger protein [Dirofilaria immitis]
MEPEQDCNNSRDPMLAENFLKYPTCICCDKEKCDFKSLSLESCTNNAEFNLKMAVGMTCEILENLYQESYSDEWREFFDQYNSTDGIQEIFVKRDDWNGPDGPRKRYQRFRDKRYICDECGRCFTLKQNVQYHIITYHLGNQQITTNRGKRYVCLTCRKVYRNAEAARHHNEREHFRLPNVQIHRCTTCTRIFPNNTQLKEHISIQHLQERPYQCNECGARFGRLGGLRRHHIMVHTDRRYNCTYPGCIHPGFKCSKVRMFSINHFSNINSRYNALAAHIRSRHTKDRPFVCFECGKRFVRRNDQRVHEMLHITHEQFDCKKCGQRFRRQIYLRKHESSCRVINDNKIQIKERR